MENEQLSSLYARLIEARSLIDFADARIENRKDEMDKFERGYVDYARNIGKVVPSFQILHKGKYEAAKLRYKTALLKKEKIIKTVDGICQELRQYATDYCVPFQYAEAARVEYNKFDNFVTISYYVDEELKELVILRLYISDSKL